MAQEKTTCRCPTCNGTGIVEAAISKNDTNRPLAKKLIKDGYSIREVARMLGYKNPGSVTHLLKESKKKAK